MVEYKLKDVKCHWRHIGVRCARNDLESLQIRRVYPAAKRTYQSVEGYVQRRERLESKATKNSRELGQIRLVSRPPVSHGYNAAGLLRNIVAQNVTQDFRIVTSSRSGIIKPAEIQD